jgi:integrase
VLISLLAFTGMRISEALGLTWADIDFEGGSVNVRRQLSHARRGEPAKRIPLKTEAGERQIDLAPKMLQALRVHRFASPHKGDNDSVFVTLTGKPIYYRNGSRRRLTRSVSTARAAQAQLPRPPPHGDHALDPLGC